jgi:hypothetical protein
VRPARHGLRPRTSPHRDPLDTRRRTVRGCTAPARAGLPPPIRSDPHDRLRSKDRADGARRSGRHDGPGGTGTVHRRLFSCSGGARQWPRQRQLRHRTGQALEVRRYGLPPVECTPLRELRGSRASRARRGGSRSPGGPGPPHRASRATVARSRAGVLADPPRGHGRRRPLRPPRAARGRATSPLLGLAAPAPKRGAGLAVPAVTCRGLPGGVPEREGQPLRAFRPLACRAARPSSPCGTERYTASSPLT